MLEPIGAVLGSTSAILQLKNVFMVSESAVLERPGAARRTPGFADAALEPTSVVLTSKRRCFTAQNHTSRIRGFRAIYELQYKTIFFIKNDTCNRRGEISTLFWNYIIIIKV